jgi:hypothetical protein
MASQSLTGAEMQLNKGDDVYRVEFSHNQIAV